MVAGGEQFLAGWRQLRRLRRQRRTGRAVEAATHLPPRRGDPVLAARDGAPARAAVACSAGRSPPCSAGGRRPGSARRSGCGDADLRARGRWRRPAQGRAVGRAAKRTDVAHDAFPSEAAVPGFVRQGSQTLRAIPHKTKNRRRRAPRGAQAIRQRLRIRRGEFASFSGMGGAVHVRARGSASVEPDAAGGTGAQRAG
mgnify:FL=1